MQRAVGRAGSLPGRERKLQEMMHATLKSGSPRTLHEGVPTMKGPTGGQMGRGRQRDGDGMGLVRVRNWQPNTWPKKRKSKQEARAAQFQRETPSGRAGVTAIESASAWGGDGSAGRAIPVAGRSTDAHFHFFISALDCQSGCNQTGALAEPKASAGSALPRHLQLLKIK
jgi:hypothetical protein